MRNPFGIAITPDGKTAWVTDQTNGEAWPINNLNTTTPMLGTPVTGMTQPPVHRDRAGRQYGLGDGR